MSTPSLESPLMLGRYALSGEIASGGMATVYFGRLTGPIGFSRVVAVKRMRPLFARDPECVMMFMDEASLAARVQHPNVVATQDVVAEGGEIFIVMEYVRGESLAALLRATVAKRRPISVPIAASVVVGALHGLHAAHEARDEAGNLLGIVHRDVSPQNILIGADGLARIVDFGIAKAAHRLRVTRDEDIKGKIAYMAPEQLQPGLARTVDRRVDVFAAGVVLWEVLAGRRLFLGNNPVASILATASAHVPPLQRDDLPSGLEAVVRKALERDRDTRYATCEEFADALEEASSPIASMRAVGDWVRSLSGDVLARRDAQVLAMESASGKVASQKPQLPSAPQISFHEISSTPLPSSALDPAPPPAHAALTRRPSEDEEPTQIRDPSVPPPAPPKVSANRTIVMGNSPPAAPAEGTARSFALPTGQVQVPVADPNQARMRVAAIVATVAGCIVVTAVAVGGLSRRDEAPPATSATAVESSGTPEPAVAITVATAVEAPVTTAVEPAPATTVSAFKAPILPAPDAGSSSKRSSSLAAKRKPVYIPPSP